MPANNMPANNMPTNNMPTNNMPANNMPTNNMKNTLLLVKVHETPTRRIVSVCDRELIGKSYEEGKLKLEVSKRFYGDREFSKEDAFDICKGADDLNFVGPVAVNFAREMEFIEEGNILHVRGIPYALCIRM